MRLRYVPAPLGLLLALAVAGCGGADSDATPAGTPTPTPASPSPVTLQDPAAGAAAVRVTRRYLAAFLAGDARAVCRLQSDRFVREQIDRAVKLDFVPTGTGCVAFVNEVVATAKKAKATTPAAPEYRVTATEADARTAKVRVDYLSSGADPDTYALVLSKGTWVVDANLDVAGS
ncbi:MAG: hypothetical protein NTV23_08305 [Propionibacteriales bacterium]|nr:hypothetical protein [Propionibacteriales bacterium]